MTASTLGPNGLGHAGFRVEVGKAGNGCPLPPSPASELPPSLPVALTPACPVPPPPAPP